LGNRSGQKIEGSNQRLMKYFTILFFPVLLHIIFTDFRVRKISIFSLFILAALSFVRLVYFLDKTQILGLLMLNVLFLLIVSGIVYLYAKLRKKEIAALIGKGDMIFILIAALNFAPAFYLFFVIVSTLTGLVFYTIVKKTVIYNEIPLAGIMAGIMSFSIIIESINLYSAYNDSIFFNILN
jgi:hypothetical protein